MLAVDMADQMSTGQKEFFFEDLLEVIGHENCQEVKRRRRVMLFTRRLVG